MISTVNALPEGTSLGNYRLLKVLGQGGFGITYVARDNQLQRTVVIKECFPNGLCVRDATTGAISSISEASMDHYLAAMAGLMREARTLASLNHERVVRVYDVFESLGSVFYVMPWLQGGSLQEKLDEAESSGQAIEAVKVESWLRDVLSALAYLHGREVYHRDIKPANILFDEYERPVLIDFGAALNRPEVTGTVTQGEFSYAYGSPEQITGKGEVGPWTDFYALAATWYRLICGMGVERADWRLLEDDCEPLATMEGCEAYPKSLLKAVDCNLSLAAKKRFQSVQDWHLALGDERDDTPVARATTPQRSRGRYALVGVLGLAGIAALAYWLAVPHESADTQPPSKVVELPPEPSIAPSPEPSPSPSELAVEEPVPHVVEPQPEPSPSKSPSELRTELAEQVYAYYKIPPLLEQQSIYRQKCQDCTALYASKLQEMESTLRLELSEERSRRAWSRWTGLENLSKLSGEYINAMMALKADATYAQQASFILEDMLVNYPVKTMEEAALMPAVKDELMARCLKSLSKTDELMADVNLVSRINALYSELFKIYTSKITSSR